MIFIVSPTLEDQREMHFFFLGTHVLGIFIEYPYFKYKLVG